VRPCRVALARVLCSGARAAPGNRVHLGRDRSRPGALGAICGPELRMALGQVFQDRQRVPHHRSHPGDGTRRRASLAQDLRLGLRTAQGMRFSSNGTRAPSARSRAAADQEPAVEALCDRLKVPGRCASSPCSPAANRVALRASRLATPQALLELLKRTDAFRRPERFHDLLAVARRDAPVIDTSRLERALAAAAKVDAGRHRGQGRLAARHYATDRRGAHRRHRRAA